MMLSIALIVISPSIFDLHRRNRYQNDQNFIRVSGVLYKNLSYLLWFLSYVCLTKTHVFTYRPCLVIQNTIDMAPIWRSWVCQTNIHDTLNTILVNSGISIISYVVDEDDVISHKNSPYRKNIPSIFQTI